MLKALRAYPSLGARCAPAWRDNARALPRAILQGAGLMLIRWRLSGPLTGF